MLGVGAMAGEIHPALASVEVTIVLSELTIVLSPVVDPWYEGARVVEPLLTRLGTCSHYDHHQKLCAAREPL